MTDTPKKDGRTRWSRDMDDALREQEGILETLLQLARQQRAMVESGDTDALVRLLDRRRTLVAQLERSQLILRDVNRDLSAATAMLSKNERDQIRTRVAANQTRLDEILTRDADDTTALQERLGGIRSELSGVSGTQRARRAYRVPSIETVPQPDVARFEGETHA